MNALVPVQAYDLEVIQRTAKLLAVSGYFDAKGDGVVAIAQLATKILAGRELGFGPFAAARGIYIIKGTPAISANLMASAVKGSGRYDYRVRELTDTNVSIEFFQVLASGKREPLGVSSFSAADAKKAGTQNMDRFPRNMLFARAMSNGVRFYCPDVFAGNAVYVPEELGANVDDDGNVVNGDFRDVDTMTGEIAQTSTDTAQTTRSGPPVQPEESFGDDSRAATTPADDTPNPSGWFHAEIAKTFPKENIDAARHWFIERYTSKMTPDQIRTSANDLSNDELLHLVDTLKQHRQASRAAWLKYRDAQAVAA